MNSLENISFNELRETQHYAVGYLGSDMQDRLAVIAITCFLTNLLKKKDKGITCYDVLLKVGKDFSDLEKNTFLKALGAICEDFMRNCNTFIDLGISPKEMPKILKKLLNDYLPF